MDFRQRLEQSRTKPAGSDTPGELDDPFACPYFATDRSGSLACLDLRLSGAVRKAVPYSYFTEMNFNIDTGIEILTTGKRIRIIGRNLARLFDYLIAYRVRYVQVHIGSDANEDGLFVKEILIEEA